MVRTGAQHDVEGYTDRDSVRPGQPVRLFVSTIARHVRVRAYRMGWYAGARARLVWRSASVPARLQPAARVTGPTHTPSAPWRPTLTVDTTGWPAGDYLLRLDTDRGPLRRFVPLTVRTASNRGAVLLVNADTTWQAYNAWGGYSLYHGPDGAPRRPVPRGHLRPAVRLRRRDGRLPRRRAAAGRPGRAARPAARLRHRRRPAAGPEPARRRGRGDLARTRRVLVAGHAGGAHPGPRPRHQRRVPRGERDLPQDPLRPDRAGRGPAGDQLQGRHRPDRPDRSGEGDDPVARTPVQRQREQSDRHGLRLQPGTRADGRRGPGQLAVHRARPVRRQPAARSGRLRVRPGLPRRTDPAADRGAHPLARWSATAAPTPPTRRTTPPDPGRPCSTPGTSDWVAGAGLAARRWCAGW